MSRKFTKHPSASVKANKIVLADADYDEDADHDEDDDDMEWPSSDRWYEFDYDDMDEFVWSTYLCDAEDAVFAKYHIFTEPSVQGGVGDMFLFDESGNDSDPISYDYSSWCDNEIELAADSASAEEYKSKFDAFIGNLLSQHGWAV